MTHLRKMMLEELQRRNYAETTIRCYIRDCRRFRSTYFHRPPDQLGPGAYSRIPSRSVPGRKLAPNTVTQRLAALRFFYVKTLKKSWSAGRHPLPEDSATACPRS